ncbi:polyketide biosynthesis enoyl-CoA hydratase PksH [Bradyrhizobium sp. USDA 4524]|uniref:enoyl-CoA hydratase/isomerase n=1 Tax=unclassified Bradyrhizobium TaxID=2631580 RepID=UPI0020A15350|nr:MULTISPECIES: enoyl-CoA hydratase/isomerase [unclassified Bradyrhizobium]MCP1846019.1 polyketide biosynthesis enoyl-CoA hydratase PksH [Bradyrhizobium sp. USDA 4538]MCP1907347.1 polyketide biosynthesis enoyl-CoA hydratase PksH [Bradyrhizobium sp. USDA 4537]MCP1985133.1 polyketide biosynthesis enoyl-CoA hydratase PksH [Bradyrhizobium sp. USDA 4539]
MNFESVRIRLDDNVCFIQLDRPQANNAINRQLIEECHRALDELQGAAVVVVLEGLPHVFCFGADLRELSAGGAYEKSSPPDLAALYDLWLRLASGPFVSVAHVRGRAIAGGIGFVAACDIVIADCTATFSLSEMQFGIIPSCASQFLIRRIGQQRARYMTLSTHPIDAKQAFAWGLVDALETDSKPLLGRHLLRLSRLSKSAIRRYKDHVKITNDALWQNRDAALGASAESFADAEVQSLIRGFVENSRHPWER